MKISIAEASASQLATYAATHLGIDCNYRDGRDKILAKMAMTGFQSDAIEVEAEEPPPASAPQAAVVAACRAKWSRS
jgi:hypothetical protein